MMHLKRNEPFHPVFIRVTDLIIKENLHGLDDTDGADMRVRILMFGSFLSFYRMQRIPSFFLPLLLSLFDDDGCRSHSKSLFQLHLLLLTPVTSFFYSL
jgi:hypothetical protein